MNRVPLTVKGEEQLREELHELRNVRRPQIIEAIATARAHGDLKENAEYHAAREQQSFTEGRIREIEDKLSRAEVIDVTKINANGKVIFGATVMLADEDTGDEVTYTIVGEDQADIKKNLISHSSPIARAMIGKEEGDIAVVDAPAGKKEYEIVEVRYE